MNYNSINLLFEQMALLINNNVKKEKNNFNKGRK